jgi:hypothetical protein
MEEEREELAIEPRGTHYVLTRTDSRGVSAELELSELSVMFLARLVPRFAREISASKAPVGSDISALVAVQVSQFLTGTDLHEQNVSCAFGMIQRGNLIFHSILPARAKLVKHSLHGLIGLETHGDRSSSDGLPPLPAALVDRGIMQMMDLFV